MTSSIGKPPAVIFTASASSSSAANPPPSTASSVKPCRGTNIPRRHLLKLGLGITPLLSIPPPPPTKAKEEEVSSALPPPLTDPSFVIYRAKPTDTPALRAGSVQPYRFKIPPTWKQTRVANILSGNYCQPKCAEPWIEVRFENEKHGKVQVVASPLVRLTNKPNARIEDIGSPEKVIASLGSFVTGNTFDPDELLQASVEMRGGLTYYRYVLETPYAITGSHNLAKATAKGDTVVLFVASANDKQWQSSQRILEAIVDSFEL